MTHLRVPGSARRVAVVGVLVFAALVAPLVFRMGVAQACACGLYSPTRGGSAAVSGETALVRTADDGIEDVYLSLTLDSDVRSGALLFPVPDRLATVAAGPPDLFTDLAALTSQRPGAAARGEPGNGGAAASPVVVENRQAIGPLDVATLSAHGAGALNSWLTGNGFMAKPALSRVVQTYLDEGWAFVAVRLRPEATGATRLDGRLDPLHLRFRTADLVYPMRLSHQAAQPVRITLYTLGTDAVELRAPSAAMIRGYAGRLPDETRGALATLTGHGTDYLIRYDASLAPADITSDFHFRVSAAPGGRAADSMPGPVLRDNGALGPALIGGALIGGALMVGLPVRGIVVRRRRRGRQRVQSVSRISP